jgi:hypothetical protein
MRSRGLGVLVAILTIARPAVVAAEPAGVRFAVALEVQSCDEVDRAELRRLFLLELRTSLPAAVLDEGGTGARVVVRCAGRAAELQVWDAAAAKQSRRLVDFAAAGRERLLALAAMELLAASWAEHGTGPVPEREPDPWLATDSQAPAAKAPAVVASAESAVVSASATLADGPVSASVARAAEHFGAVRPWRVTVAALAVTAQGSAGRLTGAGAQVSVDGPAGLGAGGDLVTQTSSKSLALGSVSIRSLTGALWGHVYRGWGRWQVSAAAGARLGAVAIEGDPTRADVVGSRVVGVSGGPLGRVRASARVVGPALLAVVFESGYHMFGVHGLIDGRQQTGVDGGWLAGQLEVGWRW